MKEAELLAMQARIKRALNNGTIKGAIISDFGQTFCRLKIADPDRCMPLAYAVVNELVYNSKLAAAEVKIWNWLFRKTEDGRSRTDALAENLSGRAKKIYAQVSPYLKRIAAYPKDVCPRVIDLGCGDAQVTKLLQDGLGLNIVGYDVRQYPGAAVNVPIKLFDGKHVDVPDGYFGAGIMTNVLHHEANNQQIIDELSRIIEQFGRLVVIETVPASDKVSDFEVTFLNDWLYNRIFHDADVSVPGTYETTAGWRARFERAGWEVEETVDLGFDQPTIQDWHVLFSMRKP